MLRSDCAPPDGLLQKRSLHALAAVLGSFLIVSSAFAGELQSLCSAAKDFASAAKTQEGIVITYPKADELVASTMAYEGVFRDRYDRGSENKDVPTLILHGDDDQIVPIGNAYRSPKLIPNATLKVYPGHRMP